MLATCSTGLQGPEGLLQAATVTGQTMLIREGAAGRCVCLVTGQRGAQAA